MRKFIIVFLIFIFKISCATNSAKLHLLHINGLNTTNQIAIIHKDKYISVAKVSPSVLWDVVYNPTQLDREWDWVASVKGFFDLVWQEWFGHGDLPTLDEITQQKMKAQGVDYPVGSDDYKRFQNVFVADYQKLLLDDGGKNLGTIINNFHGKVPPQYASVVSLLTNVESADYSNTRDYVILLPHSQGNIYANRLYSYLTQTEHFDSTRISIFGYASPDKLELGQMMCNASTPNYATSTNDGVIAMSRLFVGGSNTLSSNITIPKIESDTTGHGLSENYLSDVNSVAMLNNFINNTSNGCFKDLHNLEQIGEQKASGRMVYDSVSKSIVQIINDQICELKIDNYNEWQCKTYSLPTSIKYITSDSLSVAENGVIYLLGYNPTWYASGSDTYYTLKYVHNIGLIQIESFSINNNDPSYSSNGYNKYNNGNWFSVSSNNYFYSIGNNLKQKFHMFNNIQLFDNSPSVIYDNNLYMYTSSAFNHQIIYTQIESDAPITPFGNIINDRDVYDIRIINNMIFVCGNNKTYYIQPTYNNTTWNTLDNWCEEVMGDEQYLIFTKYGRIYRYTF